MRAVRAVRAGHGKCFLVVGVQDAKSMVVPTRRQLFAELHGSLSVHTSTVTPKLYVHAR